jgi:hypothetical protein
MLCYFASYCFAPPVHPPCGFCMLMATAATIFACFVFHILFCPCVTPSTKSLLTVAPLAPRQNAASSRQLSVYGELFGGSYPHPFVPVEEAVSAVQTGVWYAPDVEFAPN